MYYLFFGFMKTKKKKVDRLRITSCDISMIFILSAMLNIESCFIDKLYADVRIFADER